MPDLYCFFRKLWHGSSASSFCGSGTESTPSGPANPYPWRSTRLQPPSSKRHQTAWPLPAGTRSCRPLQHTWCMSHPLPPAGCWQGWRMWGGAAPPSHCAWRSAAQPIVRFPFPNDRNAGARAVAGRPQFPERRCRCRKSSSAFLWVPIRLRVPGRIF